MPSLKEIKGRIGSVRSTLKITSAMKLVASAKLRKAQTAIENMLPYEQGLRSILAGVGGLPAAASRASGGKTVLVAFASNSSLCGGFNANVIRKALQVAGECEGEVEVHSLGRKMAEAMKRAGYPSPDDYADLVAHTTYEKTTALARSLAERFEKGELKGVTLVYTHFVTSSHLEVVAEQYLPFVPEVSGAGAEASGAVDDYIIEPSPEEVAGQMLPQLMMLKFYAAVLDSEASEHAARTIAMQTASDNAEDLLGELTLEYNKGRQQKITAEILDLLGGAAQ
jgi:F-type H+-transporting ATPase subunit gamma